MGTYAHTKLPYAGRGGGGKYGRTGGGGGRGGVGEGGWGGGGGGGGGVVEALGLLTLWGVSKPSNWPLGVTVPIRVKTRRPFLSCHLAWRSHTRRISDCFVEQGGKSGAGVEHVIHWWRDMFSY